MKATDQIEFKSLNKVIDRFTGFIKKHEWVDYIISPVIVMAILLAVYAMKGVYPFGRNTIAYYDLPTQYVPFYSYAWDILHGKTGMFLAWDFGLGESYVGGLGIYVFFPTNFFLYFTTRENIIYALSILLLLKMVLSALSMSFYCKKKFGITTWTVCAGVLYACSGYVIQYYTNLFFLDYVIIFPLIVWSFERLMVEHKYRLFVLALILAFISSFQLAAMVVIYLLFKAYFVLKVIPSEMKGRSIRLFAASGIIVALFSAVLLIPSVLVTLKSSRMDLNEGFDYFNILKTVFCYFRKEKQFMMYGGEVAVGLAAIMILRGRETVNKYWNNIAMLFLLGSPILLEGINLLWHFGSYKHFPIRFGYMLTFELLIFVGTFLKNGDLYLNKIIGRAAKLIGVALLPFVAYILWAFFKQFLHSALTDISGYESYKVYFLTLCGAYCVIFLINEEKTRSFALVALVLIQAFCGCYGLIAPEIASADGPRTKYLMKSLESRALFEEEELKDTERIKSEMLNYEPNYALIVEHPSIGLWAYGIPADTESLLTDNLGYHGVQSAVMDEGGTVFSDALLGVTRILSENVDDELLYKKIEKNEGLYESIYRIPFGIVVDKDLIDCVSTSFEFHNDLFHSITGLSDELIQIEEAEKYINEENVLNEKQAGDVKKEFLANVPLTNTVNSVFEQTETSDDEKTASEAEELSEEEKENVKTNNVVNNREYVLSIPVDGKKSIYLDIDDEISVELSMKLNGKPMYFSSYLSENSNTYPNIICNGIISLGSYEDSEAELVIYTTNENLDGVKIGLLDLDVLSKGIDAVAGRQELNIEYGKNSMYVKGKVNESGTLFFPVGYSKDWSVKVNGKRVEVKPYINNAFIAVDVTEGDVDIEFMYWPQGLTIGLTLTILGAALLTLFNVVMKRGGIAGKKYERLVDKVCVYGFKTVAIAMLIVMYVIPIYIKLSL